MWSNICVLGRVIEKSNSIGDLIEVIEYDNEIFCDEKSIKSYISIS